MSAAFVPLRRALVVGAVMLLSPMGCASTPVARTDSEQPTSRDATAPRPRWGLAIHGGAGVISRENLSPEREAKVRAALTQALQAGHAVLASGGTEARNAWGSTTWDSTPEKGRPIARAASACPSGTALTPERIASQTNAEV